MGQVINANSKEFISLGVGLTGLIYLIACQSLLSDIHTHYIYVFLVTIIWIITVKIFTIILLPILKNEYQSFSLSYLIPIFILLIFGFLEIKLNIIVLILIILSYTYLIYRFYKIKIKINSLKYLSAGSLLFFLLIPAITLNNFPWLNILHNAGLGYIDDYRDAAVINTWTNYRVVSHGVHGLLLEPYHALSALLYVPFLSPERDVFSLFIGFSNIVIPSLLVYGLLSLFDLLKINLNSLYRLAILIFFLFTFSCFDYVAKQRSLQISTLLLIGSIPLILDLYRSESKSFLTIILLGVLAPLMFFARVFHGLVFGAIFFAAVCFVDKKKKVLILISLSISLLFLLTYFGNTSRSFSGNRFSFAQVFLTPSIWNIDPWILVLISVMMVYSIYFFNDVEIVDKAKELKKLRLLVIITSLSTLFFAVLVRGSSDAFYQLVPGFLIISITLIRMYAILYNPINLEEIIRRRKLFILALIAIFLVEANVKYLIPRIIPSISSEFNQISQINTLIKSNYSLFGTKGNGDKASTQLLSDSYLLFRPSNIVKFYQEIEYLRLNSSKTIPATMAYEAKSIAKNLAGVSAIYVEPSHDYWRYPFQQKTTASLYFQATISLPMIFGAVEGDNNAAYSIQSAHKAGGTSRSIDFIQDKKLICEYSKKVQISNIIVFNKSMELPYVVICNSSIIYEIDQVRN
jgi:hypothetical protein